MAAARLRGGKGAGGQRPGQGCASHEAWCTEEGLAFAPAAGYPYTGAMGGTLVGTAGRGTSQRLDRLFPMDALPFSHHVRDLDSFDEAVLLEFAQAQKT